MENQEFEKFKSKFESKTVGGYDVKLVGTSKLSEYPLLAKVKITDEYQRITYTRAGRYDLGEESSMDLVVRSDGGLTEEEKKWQRIEGIIEALRKTTDDQHRVAHIAGLETESVLNESFYKASEACMDAIGLLVGDEEAIKWYCIDNDFGRSGLRSEISGAKGMIRINNVAMLRAMIEGA